MNAPKLWGDMDASERLAASVGYLEYNYGFDSPIALAARIDDLRQFRRLTSHVTEEMDARVVAIVDATEKAAQP